MMDANTLDARGRTIASYSFVSFEMNILSSNYDILFQWISIVILISFEVSIFDYTMHKGYRFRMYLVCIHLVCTPFVCVSLYHRLATTSTVLLPLDV